MMKPIRSAVAVLFLVVSGAALAQGIKASSVTFNSKSGCFSFKQVGSAVERIACPARGTAEQLECAKSGGTMLGVTLADGSQPIRGCECPRGLLFSPANGCSKSAAENQPGERTGTAIPHGAQPAKRLN